MTGELMPNGTLATHWYEITRKYADNQGGIAEERRVALRERIAGLDYNVHAWYNEKHTLKGMPGARPSSVAREMLELILDRGPRYAETIASEKKEAKKREERDREVPRAGGRWPSF